MVGEERVSQVQQHSQLWKGDRISFYLGLESQPQDSLIVLHALVAAHFFLFRTCMMPNFEGAHYDGPLLISTYLHTPTSDIWFVQNPWAESQPCEALASRRAAETKPLWANNSCLSSAETPEREET